MPIADMTGAARNMIDAQGAQMDVNAQRKATLIQGLSGLADTVGSERPRRMIRDALVKEGFDPAEADTLATQTARDPHAGASAILDARRQRLAMEAQKSSQQSALTLHTTPSYSDTQQDKTRQFQQGGFASAFAQQEAEKAAEDARAEAKSRAIGGETSALLAPTVSSESVDAADPNSPNFNAFAGLRMGSPDDEGVGARASRAAAAGKPYRSESLGLALSRTPKPESASLVEERAAQAERDRAAAEKDRRPAPPPKPGRIDPLSPEGVKAQLDLAEQKAAQKLGAAWDGAKSSAANRMNQDINFKMKARDELLKYGAETMSEDEKQQVATLDTEIAALRARHARLTGYGGDDQPVGKTQDAAVDPSLKKEFDSFPKERQDALLQQMSKEERAKVGR